MIDRSNSESASSELPTVNRFAVTLLPTEAFANWAGSCFDEETAFTAADLGREATVYLLPETETDLELAIQQYFKPVLSQELMGWCTDETAWPELSYDTFQEFFEVYVTSMVFDLGAEPLETDD